MIFLIKYQRSTHEVQELRPFDDADRRAAEDARLESELEQLDNKNLDYEILLFEAESEAALRKTHSRYFKTVQEIAST